MGKGKAKGTSGIQWCANPLHAASDDDDGEDLEAKAPAGSLLPPSPQRQLLPCPPARSTPASAAAASGSSEGSTAQTHVDAPWYHGNIPRDAAEAHLCDAGLSEGLFLVRDSSLGPGNYALSMVYKGKIYHNSIEETADGQFLYLGPDRVFSSIARAIDHYMYRSRSHRLRLTAYVPRS